MRTINEHELFWMALCNRSRNEPFHPNFRPFDCFILSRNWTLLYMKMLQVANWLLEKTRKLRKTESILSVVDSLFSFTLQTCILNIVYRWINTSPPRVVSNGKFEIVFSRIYIRTLGKTKLTVSLGTCNKVYSAIYSNILFKWKVSA